jgi:hypothetical protein
VAYTLFHFIQCVVSFISHLRQLYDLMALISSGALGTCKMTTIFFQAPVSRPLGEPGEIAAKCKLIDSGAPIVFSIVLVAANFVYWITYGAVF